MPAEAPFTVRRAGPEDVADIRTLVRAAYSKWIAVVGREPLPMVADYELAVRDHDIHLMSAGGRIVGLIETMLRDDHLWIENVAVDPQHQGKGFGRRLLTFAEAMARQAGCLELRLLTNAAFATNVVLYQKAGYDTVEHRPFRGGTTVYMTLRLVA